MHKNKGYDSEKKTRKSRKIHEFNNSEKMQHFSFRFDLSFHITAECCLITEKLRKILGIQPTYVTGEVFWLKLNPFNALERLVRTMH